MGADAEADEGLLAQAKDNDKISGYFCSLESIFALVN